MGSETPASGVSEVPSWCGHSVDVRNKAPAPVQVLEACELAYLPKATCVARHAAHRLRWASAMRAFPSAVRGPVLAPP